MHNQNAKHNGNQESQEPKIFISLQNVRPKMYFSAIIQNGYTYQSKNIIYPFEAFLSLKILKGDW